MASLLVGIMVASLVLYALLAGADYGAGVWDLLSAGSLKEEQEELIANAIQPIWEANHVWLILIIVLLFSGFPPAFGAIMVALFVPILLMLTGIVLRGSSFVFRAYSTVDSRMQHACAYVFSMSSCFTPLFAGIIVGALSGDRIFVAQDVSVNGYVLNWLNPFTVSVGLLTVALFAFLAAAYLIVEASSEELKSAFRRRAVAAGVAVGIMAALTSILSAWYARGLRDSFMHNTVARWSVLTAGIAFAVAFFALYGRRDRLLRAMAAIHIGGIVVGWASSQYPYLVRPDRTIFNSVLSETVVRDIVFASAAGAVVLFPSLALLLYVFKDQRRSNAASSTEARP